MRSSGSAILAVALGLSVGASGCAPKPQSSKPPQAAESSSSAPQATNTQAQAAVPPRDVAIEPEAVQALQRMSAYLQTLQSFKLKADTTLDLVTKDGQRLQVGGVSQYKARRPDGFQVDVTTDYTKRRFFFDGKNFTLVAPEYGYYATAPAPPTIREALEVIYNKFGIVLPLEDLFRWNDPNSARAEKLDAAMVVGPATMDGVATDHYAFREGDHDWEVWIQQGDRPLPRKLAIVKKSDPSMPTYVARLNWTTNPTLAASDFTYKPSPDAKRIHLAATGQ